MVVTEHDANPFDNQELAAFVEATLKAVSEGVRNASSEVRQATSEQSDTFDQFSGPRTVDFDIAISVRREEGTKKGFSIGVHSVGGSFGQQNSGANEQVSRVSFSVPWRSEFTDKGRAIAKKQGEENGRRLASLMDGLAQN
jgi:hypothetical protein